LLYLYLYLYLCDLKKERNEVQYLSSKCESHVTIRHSNGTHFEFVTKFLTVKR